ncbi:arsenate reductase (glutaredoxin) [Albidovulum sp.]
MADIVIWHNPRCSKSRQTLALLGERGLAPQVRLYLRDAPGEAEIRAVLQALGRPARDLVRHREPLSGELGLTPDSSEDSLIAAMAAHPVLIERPVVIAGPRAALGRPPEAVLALF